MNTSTVLNFPIAPKFLYNDRHSKIFNILSKIAFNVDPVGSARIATAITFRNTIIAVGTNKKKTHPFQAQYGKNKESIYLHGEIDVIKNALKFISQDELSRASLYICRIKYYDETKKSLEFGLAKPCAGCERAIATFGIKKVFYSLEKEGYQVL